MSKEHNKLTDLDTLGVSLVKRGANKRRIALTKSEDDMKEGFEEILKACAELELDDEAGFEEIAKAAELSEKAINAVRGALRILNAFKDEKGLGEIIAHLGKMLGIPDEKAKAEEEKPEDYKEPDEMDKTKVAKDETDLENVDPAVRAELEKLWKANKEEIAKREEAEALLKAEREERREREFVQKAEAEFAHIPGESNELARLLKSLADTDETLAGKVEELLKAVEPQLAQSELIKERGTAAQPAGGATAWDKIKAGAASMIEKSAEKITEEKAIANYLGTPEGRELYQEYLNENPAH